MPVMNVTRPTTPWLMLVFTLTAKKASQRVGIWRKLQKYGTLALRNSGYLLPNTAVNQERFEWLATSIRGFKGQASVLLVHAIDDLPDEVLKGKFQEERKKDYGTLIREINSLKRSDAGFSMHFGRLKKRMEELVEIDFFESPDRAKAQEALHRAEAPILGTTRRTKSAGAKIGFQGRVWITRPRPGIDRVSSAWLIRKYVDPNATFTFDKSGRAHPEAVPFDMYQSGGFGHEGDNCTFETLCTHFSIGDRKALLVARAIHDADLEDEKYGRNEGIVINQILKGWADQGIEDEEILRRGTDVIEGLYRSIR